MKGILKQYSGLRREMYVLFWGMVVTSMGALIWPMLTLILTNKLGYSVGQSADIIIVIGIILLPCTLIGGKLADRFNKKNLIMCCDMVTVISYIICGIMPINKSFIVLFCIAGIFAAVEGPSYDALVADLSKPEDREKAYSLTYLGHNLGLTIAPAMGGLLFENHLSLAFIISGLATFSSTVMIFFMVKDISVSRSDKGITKYEQGCSDLSTREVFRQMPILILFVLIMGIIDGTYGIAFEFLMPLNMENVFAGRGALLFGTMTSINAIVVVFGTPVCTAVLSKVRDADKMLYGMILLFASYGIFVTAGPVLAMYYISIVVFTLGEIVLTISRQPYLTRRIPESHRGRMTSVGRITGTVFKGAGLYAAGIIADNGSIKSVWIILIGIGIISLALMLVLLHEDRKQFSLFYKDNVKGEI